jgi:hypothetical protein
MEVLDGIETFEGPRLEHSEIDPSHAASCEREQNSIALRIWRAVGHLGLERFVDYIAVGD